MELVDPALETDRYRVGDEFHITCVLRGADIDSVVATWPKNLHVLSGPTHGRSEKWVDGQGAVATSRKYLIRATRRRKLLIPALTAYSGGVAYRSAPLVLRVRR